MGDLPAYTKDLSHMGELQVVVQFCARPDLADLQAAVALIDGLVLRGENRAG
jgi:hypothetical protein